MEIECCACNPVHMLGVQGMFVDTQTHATVCARRGKSVIPYFPVAFPQSWAVLQHYQLEYHLTNMHFTCTCSTCPADLQVHGKFPKLVVCKLLKNYTAVCSKSNCQTVCYGATNSRGCLIHVGSSCQEALRNNCISLTKTIS